MAPTTRSSPARLALIYALGAGAWIVFSDRALGQIAPNLSAFSSIGTVKGLAFVAVSTLLLWGILRDHRARLDDEIASAVRSEAAARAVEERLRVATRAANVGLWDWDVVNNRVFYSNEWKAQIGYGPDELSDTFAEWETRVHPDDLPAALERIQGHLASGAAQFDNVFRFRHRDGTYRWILAQASVHRDAGGRPVAVLGSHIDITERMRMDEDVRRQAMDLELAHDAANLGVWRQDFRSGLLTLDERARRQFGVASAPAPFTELLTHIHPDDRPRVAGMFDDLTGPQGQERFSTEYRVVHPDGQVRWLSVHGRLRFEGTGEARRAVDASGTVEDISERKRAEDALRESEERLRQAQKMEAVGQLAGGVAHDFNNILLVVQGHVELMEGDPGLTKEARESCVEIARAAERAVGLTRQLLVFSRRQVMQFGELDLNTTVAGTAKMLRRVLGENIELRVGCAPSPLPLLADSAMLDMVLLNLAVNARDAMPRGGVLQVETALVEHDGRPFARLQVRDTGLGIPPDALPRVFEPFFTTKGVGKGTGLGLATVFGVVREHGGTIDVESEVGRGTTFRVLLPIHEGAPDEAKSSAGDALPPGRETVLLVEDERSVRTLLANALSRLGYRVLQAPTGAEAIEIARAHDGPIHLVVTDIVMPGGVSGIELGRALEAMRPAPKVIYTSGFSTEIAGEQTSLVEGVNFLRKPFLAKVLARLVRQRLDQSPTQDLDQGG